MEKTLLPTASTLGYQPSMTANDNDHRGLLPAGLADLLPPEAAREDRAIEIALERFAAFGYERVKPPLVESRNRCWAAPAPASPARPSG